MRSLELVLACWLVGCGSNGGTDPNSMAANEPAGGASGADTSGASGAATSLGGSAGNSDAVDGGAGGAAGSGRTGGSGGGAGSNGDAGGIDGGARAPLRLPTRVACIGDSITYGAGNIAHPYPSNLQTLFGAGVKVTNFGVSGTTILSTSYGPYVNTPQYQAATDFVASAGADAVVDVVIMLGTNDSARDNWTPDGKPKNDQRFYT